MILVCMGSSLLPELFFIALALREYPLDHLPGLPFAVAVNAVDDDALAAVAAGAKIPDAEDLIAEGVIALQAEKGQAAAAGALQLGSAALRWRGRLRQDAGGPRLDEGDAVLVIGVVIHNNKENKMRPLCFSAAGALQISSAALRWRGRLRQDAGGPRLDEGDTVLVIGVVVHNNKEMRPLCFFIITKRTPMPASRHRHLMETLDMLYNQSAGKGRGTNWRA